MDNVFPESPENKHFDPTAVMMEENIFSDSEVKRIIEIGEARLIQEDISAQIASTGDAEGIRDSKVSFLHADEDPDCAQLSDKLGHYLRDVNTKYYGFDLWGFSEGMQYTAYDAEYKGKYDWHLDHNKGLRLPRKLTMIVQLNDDYEGGELQVLNGPKETTVPNKVGSVTIFASFMLHRVKPVTKGKRRSLVVWSHGPRFI